MKVYIKSSINDNTSIFHASGYTDAGYFIEENFDNLEDAIKFFDSMNWKDADLVEERVENNKRVFITHREEKESE